MIFPGMDPYLEYSTIWPDFHNRCVVYLGEYLIPRLTPNYLATLGQRVYVETLDDTRDFVPDATILAPKSRFRPPKSSAPVAVADEPLVVRFNAVELTEAFLEIVDAHNRGRVVAVIELLSPLNKFAGPGRDKYQEKQREVRQSRSHLVEIDLLRSGPHVLAVPNWLVPAPRSNYLVCVNPASTRTEFRLYPRSLRQRLPVFELPLDGTDRVAVDLQTVVRQTYRRGGFSKLLRYDQPCDPPLRDPDQQWASELLRKKKVITG